MTDAMPTILSPDQLAADAVRAVLRTQWEGESAVRLDSPPGAGKTGIVERLAVQSMAILGERCMVTTQTNEQAFDISRRLARRYSRHRFILLTKRGLALPPDLSGLTNLAVAHSPDGFPAGPCVVISNAAKWSWLPEPPPTFDLQVVDEAFQLPDYRFHQISNLASRFVLVGDPGQIPPVVACEVERWKSDPAGPHIACPRALIERHPGVRRLSLPVSRRLVPDTVRFVQPAFYPDLPFSALCSPEDRRLTMAVSGISPLDRPLDLVTANASLVLAELPELITGPVDEELASTIVAMIARLFERRANVYDDSKSRPLTVGMIGVVCAHVSQVNAVRERLPQALSDVFVETGDRFQGLERPLIFVHHPLSGRADASEFHLDAGRLCVMTSRHRVACVMVARHGIKKQLLRYAPRGDRILGIGDDAEYQGWRAHTALIESLESSNRIIRVP